MKRIAVALLVSLISIPAFAAGLRVVSAGPSGETATLEEANEVRVVFSEPMVALGRIPSPVTAPWFSIAPAVKGTFRWSGTTTLIFTPAAKLPFGTEYTVKIDKSAKAASGATLDQTYTFTFATPSIRLIRTDFYRRGGKSDASLLVAMFFNQPVDAATLLPHVQFRTAAHEMQQPFFQPEALARLKKLEPQQAAAYEAKIAKALAAAQSNGQPVFFGAATDWDRKRWPASKEMVVVETKPGITPETWLQLTLGDKLAAPGKRPTNRVQEFTIELDPALFVSGITCVENCDPEYHNPISFRSIQGLRYEDVVKAVSVIDITDPAKETPVKAKKVERDYDYPTQQYSLDELGYTLQPARKYAIRFDPSLKAVDGQTLGYAWMGLIQNSHKSAFASFGDGHGVWEASGGPLLPFSSRNFRSVTQWLAPLTLETVLPAMQELREKSFTVPPPNAKPQKRSLGMSADRIQAHGFDLTPVIGKDNLGLAWVAMQPGDVLANAPIYSSDVRAALIQSTNLGISVKDSPQNTIVMVTRLDDAKAVAGATVSIRDRNNKVFWTGTTDANGIAVAPNTDLRRVENVQDDWEASWRAMSDLHFVVTAEKDGDVAYVGSDWNEGVGPWDFGVNYDIAEANPLLRGTIFTDRGVYKLGEEIHFKLIVRADTPNGMQLLPQGTKIAVVLRDSQNKELDKRDVAVNAWSSAEWTYKVPGEAPLGNYYVSATMKPRRGEIGHSFLVAAYRRPEFRVDTTLNANSTLAGTKLDGRIAGRYLYGGAMAGRPVRWTYVKELIGWSVPDRITDRYPTDQWAFLGWQEGDPTDGTTSIQEKEATLGANGELKLPLDTDRNAGWPNEYRLQGVVTDVTRQEIAGRASIRIDPAPWYIGVKRPPYFAEANEGIDTEIIAAGLDGLAVAGVKVDVQLKRLQWVSVRQAEGDGFYGWDGEQKQLDAGQWTVTTESRPVPLQIPIKEGGEYLLIAKATDGQGRSTTTRTWFYAVGAGYTSWQRYDHNRIDLVPEKTNYRPGETARIMVKSPWETATALLTTEREGVRTWKTFELTSTQQTITVPITEKEIPNFYVSVLLVKGRTKKDPGKDGSDPGKPSFRLGYVELKVEDSAKRLAVAVNANREEFRPATKAKIEIDVKDAKGQGTQSEVTLWAVDYGVLSLTGYTTPDVLDSIWLEKALQVANEDSRQRIVSRRVLTPKGATDGGGGGRDLGPGATRKDFRVLAFWVGSLTTDKNGKARTEITLPESLTTYRIMAVAGDRQSRFGWAEDEIKINKPVMITPSWPRFLTVGDKAFLGGVVHNQTKAKGTATVSIKSLDPAVLEVGGEQKIEVPAGGSAEVRFDAIAKQIGSARLQLRVQFGRETDAMEDAIPVRVLVTPETVAAYGEAKPRAEEKLVLPEGVVPGYGELRLELASTAMVGLGEGARYLVEYPYGCAEQRASAALALVLTSELGSAFSLPGIDAASNRSVAQSTLNELRRFQCGDGGFAYWPGDCASTSPYLTSYVLHVLQRAQKLKYTVDAQMVTSALDYLERSLATARPTNEAWLTGYVSWQSFAVKVMAEGGKNVDSHINRLYGYRTQLPLFAVSHLLDAMTAKGETGARPAELKRRIQNSILPEGGHAFVNELNDPTLVWFWSSNVRTTAIAMGTLVRRGEDEELVKRMVRWLMKVRKGGRWGNTQENAWAMESLVDYYRKYEAETPDFSAVVTLGAEQLAREQFQGRTTTAKTQQFSMQQVLAKGTPGTQLPVVFTRDGVGTLYYMLRLRYASSARNLAAMSNGFVVERSYALQNGNGAAATTFKAGDLIKVTLTIRNTKQRHFVAVTDPIPAGTEPVEAWFATTAQELAVQSSELAGSGDWMSWYTRGGFDHIERHDDRVNVFATRLGEGNHVFAYLVRATTAGTFITAPAHAEEMYEPEVFGRTATATVEVQK
jgi:uncharacterized protein YfaS (alpha-2-macroglobulin family)